MLHENLVFSDAHEVNNFFECSTKNINLFFNFRTSTVHKGAQLSFLYPSEETVNIIWLGIQAVTCILSCNIFKNWNKFGKKSVFLNKNWIKHINSTLLKGKYILYFLSVNFKLHAAMHWFTERGVPQKLKNPIKMLRNGKKLLLQNATCENLQFTM